MISLEHVMKCLTVLGQLSGQQYPALKFSTDSRKYTHPSAFVAIPGAKVNALDMIRVLLDQHCPLVIYQQSEENAFKVKVLSAQYPQTHFLAVTDSVTFLQELSRFHILEWKKKNTANTVFAISGSNGKTTHKEMLSHILKCILPGKVVATEKNNNNHLGVPLTLLEVTHLTQFVVLELGSNHPGEIKVLCDIAQPTAGVTTNIGATHLEFFGSEKEVFHEEGYLYHAVKHFSQEDGFFLINTDDKFLRTLSPFAGAITYGENSSASARISFLDVGASITIGPKVVTVHNKFITGKHNKLNLITCAFIAAHFYPEQESSIIAAAAEFKPTKNRSEWIEYQKKPVFLDAYNANPSSMKAALDGFKESVLSQGHKLEEACVVLGDMNELGESSAIYHKETGEMVKALGFTNVYFVGRFAVHYLEGYPLGEARENAASFKDEFRNVCLKRYQIHFIKGSRSLQLESLFDIT